MRIVCNGTKTYHIPAAEMPREETRLRDLDVVYVAVLDGDEYQVFVEDQRRNRKSFPQRHPNLPLVLAICALIGSIIAPLLR